jgi:putative ABC transport system permease protein
VVTTLKEKDREQILRLPNVDTAYGAMMGQEKVTYYAESKKTMMFGVTSEFLDIDTWELAKGRFFTAEENASQAQVAVLGLDLAEYLFGTQEAVGKDIKIGRKSFTVIGVFKEKGAGGFGVASVDDSVFVPLLTAQKLFLGIDYIAFIRAKVKSADLVPYAIANVKITLRERHGIDNPADDDFSVRDQAQAVEMIRKITNVLTYFLLSIGTISLVVGGVGIMNTMLIIVNQRIREVGLRKAVGAKNKDIMLQFLIESSTISFFGGLIGIIIGIVISFIAALIMQALKYKWPFMISWESILVATFVSIGIGILFGVYPAHV